MKIYRYWTPLDGVLIVKPDYHYDERGYFAEVMRLDMLDSVAGVNENFVQANHSHSTRGVLRGMHAEQWAKFIYVPQGEVLANFVDLRRGSPSFGYSTSLLLSDKNERLGRVGVFLPEGFANGYQVLSDSAEYIYWVTKFYDGSDVSAIRWDDPDLNLSWPIKPPILSERDEKAPSLREFLEQRRKEED